jgi:CRISPR/Cas system CSM-associated protein Csm3 (group 7 of RAMP superfamily)
MNEIKSLEESKIEKIGTDERYCFNITVDVEEGSFLHIGGSPNPLTGKKSPIFMINEVPAIPATSFKGALRHATELYIQTHFDELRKIFNLDHKNLLVPCLPASKPTPAEKSLKNYRSRNCEIKFEGEKLKISEKGICPVCYLFGANGLMGFLRFNNFLATTPGQKRMEQTNIRIDRKLNTAARSAIVSGDQVLPGTKFEGSLEIILKDESYTFGKTRKIGDKVVDQWLNGVEMDDLDENRIKIINNLVFKPLSNIDRLGGQKSRGGGKVYIKITE